MKKLMFIFGLLALVASCTPESLTSDEQQLDKDKYEVPPNGQKEKSNFRDQSPLTFRLSKN